MTDKLPHEPARKPVDRESTDAMPAGVGQLVRETSELAARIEALAASDGLLLEQDETLTGLLTRVPGSEEIPATLYVAIAEVLSFLNRLEESADRN